MSNLVLAIEDYNSKREREYKRYVNCISSSNSFHDDAWSCDKLRRSASEKSYNLRLDFRYIPEEYKTHIKYYAIINLMGGHAISTVKNKLQVLAAFYEFAFQMKMSSLLDVIDDSVVLMFKEYLDKNIKSEEMRRRRWLVAKEFCEVFYHKSRIRLFSQNPYKMMPNRIIDERYIPEYILKKTDRIFSEQNLEVHKRLIYWLLRLIPSRAGEICGMELNCLNLFNGKYVLFIPTWKQNGGYKEPQVRAIYLDYTGVSQKLIDLVLEQQKVSMELQRYVVDENKGMLLTYRKQCTNKASKYEYSLSMRNVRVIGKQYINRMFKQICEENGLVDENGKPYYLTSHQFRHNGITDRLEHGFTPEQIRAMTGHQGKEMIMESYNHTHLNEAFISRQQRAVIGTESEEKVLFKGRILGMDEKLESRLLGNARAHRIRGGICSDITGCKSDMLNCCECEFFVVDAGQLEYFRMQLKQWKQKETTFAGFPIIRDNARHNIKVYETIIETIFKITGGNEDEKDTR